MKKNPNDQNFPFTIVNSWDEKVSCTRADLEQLQGLIAHALGEEPPQPTPRIATRGSIGGQMVQAMINASIERRK